MAIVRASVPLLLGIACVGCATFDGTIKAWKPRSPLSKLPKARELVVERPRVMDSSAKLKPAVRQRLAASLQTQMVERATQSRVFGRCLAASDARDVASAAPAFRLSTELRISRYRTPRGGVAVAALALPFVFAGGLQLAGYIVGGKIVGHIRWELRDPRGRLVARRSKRFDHDIGGGSLMEAERAFALVLQDAAAMTPAPLPRPMAPAPARRPARRRVTAVLPMRDASDVLTLKTRSRAIEWLVVQLTELGWRVTPDESVQRALSSGESRPRSRPTPPLRAGMTPSPSAGRWPPIG